MVKSFLKHAEFGMLHFEIIDKLIYQIISLIRT